jgi:beta-lactamase class D
MMKQILAALFMLLASQAHALEWEQSDQVAALFEHAGVNGAFVVYDVAAQRLIGHDRTRAETRFVPASTFKVPHSLIGLSVGAVRSVDEVLPYGGRPQPFKAWEKDMGLREAIALSNVPIYQSLARRIGLARMKEALSRLDFGNGQVGASVDTFWLKGPLKISAVEQTRFLAKLAQGTLPFPPPVQESVRDIVRIEQRGDWVLYGKTGWENAPDQGVGWWVGWVQKGDRIYAFALNMDIRQAADAAKRIELGKASLGALGILD